MNLPNFFFIAIALLTLGTASSFAEQPGHKDEAEKQSTRFGDSMAVLAFDKENGFKLSDLSLKTLGVQFIPLSASGSWKVPTSALVSVKHSVGVYRLTDGWISLVLVKVLSKDISGARIQSEDLLSGDDVAISGTQFLRMAELDLNSDTVDNCSH